MATTPTTTGSSTGGSSPAPSPFVKQNPNQTVRPAPSTTTPAPATSSQQTSSGTTTSFVEQNPNQSKPIGNLPQEQRPPPTLKRSGGSSSSRSSSLSSQEVPQASFVAPLPASRPAQPLLSSSQQSSSQVGGGNLGLGGKNYSVQRPQMSSRERPVVNAQPVRSQPTFRPDFMQLAQAQQSQQTFVKVNPAQSIDYNKLPTIYGGNPLEPTFSLASPRIEFMTSKRSEIVPTQDGGFITRNITNTYASGRSFGTALEAQQAQINITPSQRQALQESSIQGQALALQRQRENLELQQIANQNRGFIRTTAVGIATQFFNQLRSTNNVRQASFNTFVSGGLSPNIKSNIQRTVSSQFAGTRDLLTGNFSGFGTNLKESASGAFGLLSAPFQQASFIGLSKEEKAFFKANPQIVTSGFNRRDTSLSTIENFGLNFPLVEPITQEALSFTSRPIGSTLGKAQSAFIGGASGTFQTQEQRRLATRIAVTQKEATVFGQGVVDVATSGAVEALGKSRFVVGSLGGKTYEAVKSTRLARNIAVDISKQIALKAGPVEAFINVESQAGGRGQTASYTDLALGVGTGAISAGTASYAQNYPRLTGNKAMTRFANIATYGTDPSELVGDIGEQSVANIRIRGGEKLSIPQVNLNFEGGRYTAKMQNVVRTAESPFDFGSGSKSSVRTVTIGFSPASTTQTQSRGVTNPITTLQSRVNSYTQTQTRGQTSSDATTSPRSQTSSRTNSKTNIITNPFASAQSTTSTATQTQSQTQTQTQAQSAVGTFVSPNTSSFVNFFPGLIPDYGGGGGGGPRRRKGSGRSRKAYTRDVTAVLFGNLFQPPKGKGYKQSLAVISGLGVRF